MCYNTRIMNALTMESESRAGEQVAVTPTLEQQLEANGFEAFWQDVAESGFQLIPQKQLETERKAALEREKAFYTKVSDAAMLMAGRQSGKVTLLFDVDMTLRDPDAGTIRPAFPLVINDLTQTLGDRLEVGLVTEIMRSYLEKELGAHLLAGVTGRVNPAYLISSGSEERDAQPNLKALREPEDTNDNKALLASVAGIIRPDLKESIEQGEDVPTGWFDMKLPILQHLVDKDSDRGFVIVDDLPYVNSIDSQSDRIHGVCVATEMQNLIRLKAAATA